MTDLRVVVHLLRAALAGLPAPEGDTCRACGRRAVFVPALGRLVHDDGTDNRACWRGIP